MKFILLTSLLFADAGCLNTTGAIGNVNTGAPRPLGHPFITICWENPLKTNAFWLTLCNGCDETINSEHALEPQDLRVTDEAGNTPSLISHAAMEFESRAFAQPIKLSRQAGTGYEVPLEKIFDLSRPGRYSVVIVKKFRTSAEAPRDITGAQSDFTVRSNILNLDISSNVR